MAISITLSIFWETVALWWQIRFCGKADREKTIIWLMNTEAIIFILFLLSRKVMGLSLLGLAVDFIFAFLFDCKLFVWFSSFLGYVHLTVSIPNYFSFSSFLNIADGLMNLLWKHTYYLIIARYHRLIYWPLCQTIRKLAFRYIRLAIFIL